MAFESAPKSPKNPPSSFGPTGADPQQEMLAAILERFLELVERVAVAQERQADALEYLADVLSPEEEPAGGPATVVPEVVQ